MGSILLIEDAPQVAGILVSKLQREGHKVVWTRDRARALEALGKSAFDLVLLSTYLLPERNAWELLPELAARKLRVVMVLDAEEEPLAAQARETGACGIIQKPFKPTQVARQVREWLEGRISPA